MAHWLSPIQIEPYVRAWIERDFEKNKPEPNWGMISPNNFDSAKAFNANITESTFTNNERWEVITM